MYTAVEELLELMYKDQIEDLWDELNDNEYWYELKRVYKNNIKRRNWEETKSF
jgi:hypothetical protein